MPFNVTCLSVTGVSITRSAISRYFHCHGRHPLLYDYSFADFSRDLDRESLRQAPQLTEAAIERPKGNIFPTESDPLRISQVPKDCLILVIFWTTLKRAPTSIVFWRITWKTLTSTARFTRGLSWDEPRSSSKTQPMSKLCSEATGKIRCDLRWFSGLKGNTWAARTFQKVWLPCKWIEWLHYT